LIYQVPRLAQEALMQNPHATTLTRLSAAALFGVGALSATACSSGTPVGAAAPSASIAAAGAAVPGVTPIAVNCGPGQQALIRPSLIAGQTISQVECVPVAAAMAGSPYGAVPGAMPAAYYGAPAAVEAPVVYRSAPRRVVYDEPVRRVVRRPAKRSWQKSAVIIGSSAGIGAAAGGAFKGKKGALIGAAIGGGAATIWDQATRHK
jgi:hypothetical protein